MRVSLITSTMPAVHSRVSRSHLSPRITLSPNRVPNRHCPDCAKLVPFTELYWSFAKQCCRACAEVQATRDAERRVRRMTTVTIPANSRKQCVVCSNHYVALNASTDNSSRCHACRDKRCRVCKKTKRYTRFVEPISKIERKTCIVCLDKERDRIHALRAEADRQGKSHICCLTHL